MKDSMKITTKQLKTKNQIVVSYPKELCPEIEPEKLEEIFQGLSAIAGARLVFEMGVDEADSEFGIYMKFKILDEEDT